MAILHFYEILFKISLNLSYLLAVKLRATLDFDSSVGLALTGSLRCQLLLCKGFFPGEKSALSESETASFSSGLS